MAASQSTKTVTAGSLDELNAMVKTEIIEQGWQTEGAVINNPDGTYSQKLVKT